MKENETGTQRPIRGRRHRRYAPCSANRRKRQPKRDISVDVYLNKYRTITPMADEITDILLAAWRRVRETLRGNPEEVRRRLRRGREKWTKRPPRAWCLAVRASDTRITPMTVVCVPEEAAYPRECVAGEMRTAYQRHAVTLDVELLRELCAPVRIHEWGESQEAVAARVGRSKQGLAASRATGRLTTRFDMRGGDRRRPRPIICAEGWLDPSTHFCAAADPVWGWTGKIASWRVPEDLPAQEVERVPIYMDRTSRYADKSGLHPEHPLVDPPERKRGTPHKLAPPPPDHVWYKWKGDEYIGYDWRSAETNPLIRENYERYQRKRAKQRESAKVRRRENPPASRAGGSIEFRGWMWLCPACGKRKKTLYYPLPPVNVIRGYGCYVIDEVIDAALAGEPTLGEPLRASLAGLACKQCHHVGSPGRVRKEAWGEAVTYLSGGLLYGYEVPRPAWFTPDRKRAYRPHLGVEPSRRRPQVLAMMLRGMTANQIGRELGISKSTVESYGRQLYARHGVRGLRELRRKLGAGAEALAAGEFGRRVSQ